ncbi:hypothetical protein MBLNU457_g0040t1 [Dothideomycetes sp. NU457]
MALQPSAHARIDRQTTTPFLLRLYYRSNAFHSPHEFTTVPPTPSLQQSSLQIYTWPNATLSELTSLFTSALPDLLPSPAAGTRIGYRLLFPDTRSVTGPNGEEGRGRWLSRELGSVVVGEAEMEEDGLGLGRLGGDAEKTLSEARFVIGDYVSAAIFPPLPGGGVAPLPGPPVERGGRGMGDGFGRGGFGGRLDSYRGGVRGGRNGFSERERGFGGVPSGDWRRGERVPEGPSAGRGRGRGRPY